MRKSRDNNEEKILDYEIIYLELWNLINMYRNYIPGRKNKKWRIKIIVFKQITWKKEKTIRYMGRSKNGNKNESEDGGKMKVEKEENLWVRVWNLIYIENYYVAPQ